jgi:hypothetical protein
MKNLEMGLGLVALLVCVSLLLLGAAQETKDESQTTRYGITGCLQEGRHANEYHLVAENAKWRLQSDKVRLADHVGHKVKVNGVKI